MLRLRSEHGSLQRHFLEMQFFNRINKGSVNFYKDILLSAKIFQTIYKEITERNLPPLP